MTPLDHSGGPSLPAQRLVMNEIARMLDELLNGGADPRINGFVLLTFPFGGEPGRRVNYISNGQRGDMVAAMREWLERAENA